MEEVRPRPEGNHYAFFQNTECEYFPCHETKDPSRFNCLFCYCPLYSFSCPGDYTLIRKEDRVIKNCRGCTFPHKPENYDRLMELIREFNRTKNQKKEE